MPRVGRVAPGGVVQHVLNRGNRRGRLFAKAGDYDAFLRAMLLAAAGVPGVRVLGWCLMPNHWHLVLWPTADGELSRFMLRLTTTHVRRAYAHRRATAVGGHLYQGRFKSFPVQEDVHLATVLRYAEANAGRAGLAGRCRDWAWGSLRVRLGLSAGWGGPGGLTPDEAAAVGQLLYPSPVELPADWEAVVDDRMAADRLATVRACGRRGRPFGDADWTAATADRLGLGFTLRGRGRPKKPKT